MEIRFYHLQKQNIDQALPALLKKALEREMRIVVHARDLAHAKTLDKHLWVYQADSFLPHGSVSGQSGSSSAEDGQNKSAHQPIWIDIDITNPPNMAADHGVVMVELADLDVDIMTAMHASSDKGYDLVCYMFEDWDNDRMTAARAAWKALDAVDTQDLTLSYWQQSGPNGGWEKKK